MIKCDFCDKNIWIHQKVETISKKDYKMHAKCAEQYYCVKMQEDENT